MKTDFGGLPIAFHLTGGEASDSRNFETLLDIGPDINPRAALGDKGYDSSNRVAARQRGICPAIPYRSNTKDMPAFFPKTLYKARARIEQAVGKLKRFKRIALRCEKTAQNYGSFVALALGFILIKIRPARASGNYIVRNTGLHFPDRLMHWDSSSFCRSNSRSKRDQLADLFKHPICNLIISGALILALCKTQQTT